MLIDTAGHILASRELDSATKQIIKAPKSRLRQAGCVLSEQQTDEFRFRRGIRHCVVGFNGCRAVEGGLVHGSKAWSRGVEHKLNVLFFIRPFRLDESAQTERPGDGVQHNHHPTRVMAMMSRVFLRTVIGEPPSVIAAKSWFFAEQDNRKPIATQCRFTEDGRCSDFD
jgi:hypothetical protein